MPAKWRLHANQIPGQFALIVASGSAGGVGVGGVIAVGDKSLYTSTCCFVF